MDLDSYYTALPDGKSELAIFVKNGFFSYGSTVKDSQASQTYAQDEESQDVQTPTKFMLRNITVTVKKVRVFDVCFLSSEACLCTVPNMYLRCFGLVTHSLFI
jgi:hypothetical protein